MTLQLTSTRFGLADNAYVAAEQPTNANEGVGLRTDEWVYYSAQIRPYYDQLNGIIGQLAGLMILGQARSCFEAYYSLAATPLDQLEDCRSALAKVRPPAIAAKHFAHLSRAAQCVDDSARALRQSVASPEQLRLEIPRMVSQLEAASAMLRCAADPLVRLQTIDFGQGCACCSTLPVPAPSALASTRA